MHRKAYHSAAVDMALKVLSNALGILHHLGRNHQQHALGLVMVVLQPLEERPVEEVVACTQKEDEGYQEPRPVPDLRFNNFN